MASEKIDNVTSLPQPKHNPYIPTKSPKRTQDGNAPSHRKPKKPRHASLAPTRPTGAHDEVLAHDIDALHELSISPAATTTTSSELPELRTELILTIKSLSSTGVGLASHANRIYALPFSYPGDVVRARVTRHITTSPAHSTAFPVRILTSSELRDDAQVKCKYFGTCSGCQFQALHYPNQLAHKRMIIKRAYANYSNLPVSAIRDVGETIGSPRQYKYRTKLTPHFDGPKNARQVRRKGEPPNWDGVPSIGFNRADDSRKVLDVEQCVIGTEAVNIGLTRERERVAKVYEGLKRGATILLRESVEKDLVGEGVVEEGVRKTCVSDNKGFSTEYVSDLVFKNPANAFFQNNNSILPVFTGYVRNVVQPKDEKLPNLIDAYCGSGLFSITLSSLFENTLGIDISAESIRSAKENLVLNGLASADDVATSSKDETKDSKPLTSKETEQLPSAKRQTINFVTGDASSLFASADTNIFRGENTAVIIDPPRKGCDEPFLKQLLAFAPQRIVYVSCNVHTQARDVGWILRDGKDAESKDDEVRGDYELESLQGFDFFPQTASVETVAILQRKGTEGEARYGED